MTKLLAAEFMVINTVVRALKEIGSFGEPIVKLLQLQPVGKPRDLRNQGETIGFLGSYSVHLTIEPDVMVDALVRIVCIPIDVPVATGKYRYLPVDIRWSIKDEERGNLGCQYTVIACTNNECEYIASLDELKLVFPNECPKCGSQLYIFHNRLFSGGDLFGF